MAAMWLAAFAVVTLASGPVWAQENQGPRLPGEDSLETSAQKEFPKGEIIPPPIKLVEPVEPDADGHGDAHDPGFNWSKVPPIFPTPRTGCFFIAPTGPGYYSARDLLEHNYRETAPKYPTSPPFLSPDFTPFFDADYRYLDDPKNTQFDFFDPIKRMHPTPYTMITLGGEERLRYMDEINSRLVGKDNSYLLTRSRVWTDLWYKDIFRVYVEFLDARSTHQNQIPLLVDVDHADFLDLFAELKIGDFLNH